MDINIKQISSWDFVCLLTYTIKSTIVLTVNYILINLILLFEYRKH